MADTYPGAPRLDQLRVGTFNVRGLIGNEEEIQRLWIERDLDVLAVTETWLRPEKTMPLGLRHESVRLRPPSPHGRGVGGVSLILKQGIEYKLLKREHSGRVRDNMHRGPHSSRSICVSASPRSKASEFYCPPGRDQAADPRQGMHTGRPKIAVNLLGQEH